MGRGNCILVMTIGLNIWTRNARVFFYGMGIYMSKNLKKSNTRWPLVVYDVIVYIIASILLLSYEYKIGKDGIIQERNYKKSNSEEKEEVSTSESVEEPETKKEEKKESTSFDENQQQAINAALANAGLGEEDVTDIGCTLDEATQQYTVTFTFQDIKNTCMVDAANFVVLSSIQG